MINSLSPSASTTKLVSACWIPIAHEKDKMEQSLLDECMARIIASPVFINSVRLQKLLWYLVNESFAGNGIRLKGYSIGVEVFERGMDFDPSTDAIVRVEVGRLRSKLKEYYAGYGQYDTVRIHLPKGGYAVEFLQRHLIASQAPPSTLVQRLPRIVDKKLSIAVLPFANLSAKPGQDCFAHGITDSLIFGLSRLSGVLVISRQSSFSYHDFANSTKDITDELGVKYLLEGSVQRSGPKVRVIVQLIDTSSSMHIWSGCFDEDIRDIFALQDEITRSIKVLLVKLAPAKAALFGHEETQSVEAHEALLRDSGWLSVFRILCNRG